MNLHDIWRALQNLCKSATQTLVPNDSGIRQITQMKFMGQTQDVKQVIPYGLVSSSPINSEWLIFSRRANPDDKVGIANDYKGRFKGTPTTNLFNSGIGLKPGESALYNQVTGCYIFLDADKNINVIGKNDLNITIDANENVSIGGNSTVNIAGDRAITIDGIRTTLVKGDSGETIEGNEERTIKGDSTIETQGAAVHTYKGILDVTVEGTEDRTNLDDITLNFLGNKSEIGIGTKTIQIPTTNHTGIINLTGTLNITGGDAIINGIAFTPHVHDGVQAGSDDSGGPKNPEP